MTPEQTERRRLFHVWRQIIRRCHDPLHKQYDDYGARGIDVCAQWRASFDAFIKDMGPRQGRVCIDRQDNDKGYSPVNCRWVSRKISNVNRRNVIFVDWNGERLCLKDAAACAGVSYVMVKKRVALGMDARTALTLPSRRSGGSHAKAAEAEFTAITEAA